MGEGYLENERKRMRDIERGLGDEYKAEKQRSNAIC